MEKAVIKKAWKQYFDEVKHNLDKDGWYNGSNDLIQKTFPNIEVEKARHHQRPLELTIVKKVDVKQKKAYKKKKVVDPIINVEELTQESNQSNYE